jgi:hypothetical protein
VIEPQLRGEGMGLTAARPAHRGQQHLLLHRNVTEEPGPELFEEGGIDASRSRGRVIEHGFDPAVVRGKTLGNGTRRPVRR